MKKTLTVSKSNMNGDRKQTLVDELHTAIASLTTAIRDTKSLTIHGRNFQTVPDANYRYRLARKEQVNRITALMNVREELHALQLAIYNDETTTEAHVLDFPA